MAAYYQINLNYHAQVARYKCPLVEVGVYS
jgi:hypothetical protein